MSKNNYCQSTYKLIIYKIGAPNIVQSCWEWNSFVAQLISFLLSLDVSVVRIHHHPELQGPMIALAVGLHFYPLAKVFKRKIDYYIGLWTYGDCTISYFSYARPRGYKVYDVCFYKDRFSPCNYLLWSKHDFCDAAGFCQLTI